MQGRWTRFGDDAPLGWAGRAATPGVCCPQGVVEIPLLPKVTRRIGLIWASDRPMAPAQLAFHDFVRSQTQPGSRDSLRGLPFW